MATKFRVLHRQPGRNEKPQIPFGTFDDGSTAYWNTGMPNGSHCLISGAGGSGRTMLVRTIAEQLAMRSVSTLFIGWRPEEHIPASRSFICGTVTGCDRSALMLAARALRAVEAEQMSRTRRTRLRRIFTRRPRPLVVIIDDAEQVLTSWARYSSGHDISSDLTEAAPLAALDSILALSRATGISVCLSIQRPDVLDLLPRSRGSIGDTFKTRCALGITGSGKTARQLWNDHTIRDPYTTNTARGSVGRAFVTHPVAGVAPADVWHPSGPCRAAATSGRG